MGYHFLTKTQYITKGYLCSIIFIFFILISVAHYLYLFGFRKKPAVKYYQILFSEKKKKRKNESQKEMNAKKIVMF